MLVMQGTPLQPAEGDMDKDEALREAIKELLTAKHAKGVGYIGYEADVQEIILSIERVRTKMAPYVNANVRNG